MQEENQKIFSLENRTKYFTHCLVSLSLLVILVFSLLLIGNNKPQSPKSQPQKDIFGLIVIEAKAAVVWDVINKKALFTKNGDLPLPLASLTKVITAVTTDGKLSPDQKVQITKEDLSPMGDSDLIVGDTWQARDLRDFTLLTSSNDGAFALAAISEKAKAEEAQVDAQAEFVREMNETAHKIGLKDSRFFNEHGLDQGADRGGAYGSAKDMALLFEYTLKNYPEILEITRYKNIEFTSAEKKYNAENTNVIIDKIPGIIASKTGYTDLAGGNLVIAFDAGINRPIIISVLGSTEKGRFTDVLQLVEATLKQVENL